MLDAIVVGGGPAGLLAALYLARFRRSVTVVDDGRSRALRIPRSHNYPGFADGLDGPSLIAALHEQVARYPIARVAGEVAGIDAVDGGFDVVWTGGRVAARGVVLATGASDVEPEMAHIAEALRDGAVRYCPVCDGYEVIDQAVGVLADGAAGVREAVYLRTFTDRLTVFALAGADALPAAERAELARHGIACAEGAVESLRHWQGRVTVRHGNDETACDTLYSALGMQVRSALATALGAACDDDGYLEVDRFQRTGIAGLYAVGDVASGLNQISVAFGAAAIAAASLHRALAQEDDKLSRT